MRDPSRIPIIIAALQEYWEKNPDMRLGQMVAVASDLRDPYYMEDDVIYRWLLKHYPKKNSAKAVEF
jgi:uncharacterized protein YihD (DUF1040 family)